MTHTPPLHLFLFHGLGANGEDLLPLGQMLFEAAGFADDRVAVHTPDAPIQPVTINGGMSMPSWFDIHGLDRKDPIDLPGIEAAVTDMVARIDEKVGDAPYLLGGFSQGGVIALRAAMRSKAKPLGILLLSTWLPGREAFAVPIERRDIPVFIGHGTQDEVVPVGAADRMAQYLREEGVTELTERRYPMGHSVVPEELQDLAEWLRTIHP